MEWVILRGTDTHADPITMRHGSHLNPANPFQSIQLEWDQAHLESMPGRRIEYIDDQSRQIVTENHSPDIPYRFGINPYRGCAHGCAYCYARPSHEFLGLNAGLDFETKIVVKRDAAKLFREFLTRSSWKPESITFSGVTDCYQPAEREFRLTRQCLEVALEFRQPISIVTKNALIVRDLDLLAPMASLGLVHVFLSITTLDAQLARDLEPRTSIPAARLRAISELKQAGVPVGMMTAPLIPGLNESEIPELLAAGREAGAEVARYILLRLPGTVAPVFVEWLERTRPDAAEKILGRIRSTRGGQLNRSEFGTRMRGAGEIAEQIRNLFRIFQRKHELDGELPTKRTDQFRVPQERNGQKRLF